MSAKRSSTSAKKSVDPETFDTRDVVLGKIRGFPPWPGMVSRVVGVYCSIRALYPSSYPFLSSLPVLWRYRSALKPRIARAPLSDTAGVGRCGEADLRAVYRRIAL